jgi:ABC-type transport system involved in cytochrome bd biosynthesis fused ATPase/permease subunit
VVAARDDVDHNRNLLFSCNRSESQKLDQDVRMLLPQLFRSHCITTTAWFFSYTLKMLLSAQILLASIFLIPLFITI